MFCLMHKDQKRDSVHAAVAFAEKQTEQEKKKEIAPDEHFLYTRIVLMNILLSVVFLYFCKLLQDSFQCGKQ